MKLVILLYSSCARIFYGILCAYLSHQDKEISRILNQIPAVFVSILGPISLVMALGCTRFAKQGVKLK